ncbi:uncharacterized protein LOC109861022 [Pseudomyrmex gracilis]|uniref:uncharacterized protein LOC109861022 n=1 Tax=Pseudomyrmex gracilis TaxID=219809 RepID=UPI000994DA8F|nr:uncharacterized protein LOC109861022 [Pseudomyrmex gracilis]
MFIFLFMEATRDDRDIAATIDIVVFCTCISLLVIKCVSITVNREKLARNIRAAINDWSSVVKDEDSLEIMKKNAFKTRRFTLILTWSIVAPSVLYIFGIVYVNLKQALLLADLNATEGDNITINWMFLIPSGMLGSRVTGPQYAMIFTVQIFQIAVICLSQLVSEPFYINVTLHLAGQLGILKRKFENLANKPDTVTNRRKQLASLVDRHCELTELNENLEDTFHLIIFFQIVLAGLLLSITGLRIEFCIRTNNYFELTKSILVMNFCFLQSMMYSYGGEFVQAGSEDIFHAMFKNSWFTLPATLMKDLRFAMMRSSNPFRLTGGKLFYTNRETIVFLLRRTVSYISVLRIALGD